LHKLLSFILMFVGVISSPGGEAPKLIMHDQIKLTLAGAQLIVTAAKQRAVALTISENIAVVDDGGHLLAFERMDGARPASAATAITKAVAAATMRRETGPIFKGTSQDNATLNVAIEHAAAASGGKLTILNGGIPIIVKGQVVGAIGVGGGTEEQDVSVGKTGAAALQTALSETRASVKPD